MSVRPRGGVFGRSALLLAAAAMALGVLAPAVAARTTACDASESRACATQAAVDEVPSLRGRGAMIAARQRFFGRANVDAGTGRLRRDRVILSWIGVANFAMAIRGHVVLLDAWVSRGPFSGYVPTTPEEVAQLRPELIFIGHGHFDHAGDATPLALATRARLIGTAEHCADLRARIPGRRPGCTAVVPAGARPGTVAPVRSLRGVGVRAAVMRHMHSGATPPDGTFAPVMPTPTPTIEEHPPSPEDAATYERHLGDPEGGSLLYRFRVGRFTLVWHDTSGPLLDRAPGLLRRLHRLRPVSVQLGAIFGFNMSSNGFRDPLSYARALRPRLFVPTHHDDWWLRGLTTRAKFLEPAFRSQFAKAFPSGGPRVRYIRDPQDYIRPKRLTFRVGAAPRR